MKTSEKISIETAYEIAMHTRMNEEIFPLFYQAIQKAEWFLMPGTCCRIINRSDAKRDLIAIKKSNLDIVILFCGENEMYHNYGTFQNPLSSDQYLNGINVSNFQ